MKIVTSVHPFRVKAKYQFAELLRTKLFIALQTDISYLSENVIELRHPLLFVFCHKCRLNGMDIQ